jgi:hypothetical protein
LGNQQPSKHPHEAREGASREGGKEANSVAAPGVADDVNGDESGLVDEAIQQLKGGK